MEQGSEFLENFKDDDVNEITQNLNNWRLNDGNNNLQSNLSSSAGRLSWPQSPAPPPMISTPSPLSPSLPQQRQEFQYSNSDHLMRSLIDYQLLEILMSQNNVEPATPYYPRQTAPSSGYEFSLPSSSYSCNGTNGINQTTTRSHYSDLASSSRNPTGNGNYDFYLASSSRNPHGNVRTLKSPEPQRFRYSNDNLASSSTNPYPYLPDYLYLCQQDDLENWRSLGSYNKNNNYNNYGNTRSNVGYGFHGGQYRGNQSPAAVRLRSVEEARGRVADVARDQHNCRFLENKLSEGSPEEIDLIVSETMADLKSLSVHQIGNYLVQKLIAVVDHHNLPNIIWSLTADKRRLTSICTDDYGNKVMIKLVERLKGDKDKQIMLMKGLCRITKTLTVSANCKHLLDNCILTFSYEVLQPLLCIVASNFIDMATDKNGCCALQTCIGICYRQKIDDGIFNRFVANVIDKVYLLSNHPFGNYVVQCVIELEVPEINFHMREKLRGGLSNLSLNKGSSNVVEKLILFTENHIAEEIIVEIMESTMFLQICQDRYGNYVAQTALKQSKEKGLSVHKKLCEFVMENIEKLGSHEHGENVVRAVRGGKKTNSRTTAHSQSF